MKPNDLCGWCAWDMQTPDDCICDTNCGAYLCNGIEEDKVEDTENADK